MKSIYDIAFQAAEDIRNRVRKDSVQSTHEPCRSCNPG